MNGVTTTTTQKPVIVVLEGLSGASSCIRGAGGIARNVSLRSQESVYAALEDRDFDGILLTGGGDVNPARYGKKPHKKVYGVDDNRDWSEMYALEVAREMGVPVLGICRGSQIMTVEAGGDLRQHIGGHYGSHPVIVKPGSVLAEATCGNLRPIVRSLHHQEVLHVAPGWQISGTAPDGTVEAVESLDRRCLGVQFHPEMHQSEAYARNIMRWLVDAASKRAGIPTPPKPSPLPPVTRKRTKSRKATAGQQRLPLDVSVTYFCPFDGIRFDERQDQIDHLIFVHSIEPDETGRIHAETVH